MKYSAKLSEKYYVDTNERFLMVKFELIEPNRMELVAGQYVSLKVSERGDRRSYSIASTPDTTHGFSLLVEMLPEGMGSKYLKDLEIGASVEVLAPLGKFCVTQPNNNAKRLFVATGSGIVPIWSMINDLLLNQHSLSPVRLHWGMKSENDLFWVDNLERLAEAHPNFVYDIVLSRGSEEWELCRGHVQDCLSRDFPTGELSEWEGYVCGSKDIVLDICDRLIQLKMPSQRIYHEKFT